MSGANPVDNPVDDAPGRIALVHALDESMQPIAAAFDRLWPQAPRFDVLDSALSRDRATGNLTPAVAARVLALLRYAVEVGGPGSKTAAILFTATAFGPALAAARNKIAVPILSPHQSAFTEAAASGQRVALLVSFPPSETPLERDLASAITAAGADTRAVSVPVPGALDALQNGDTATHDGLIAEAAAATPADLYLLGQFSMARAAPAVEAAVTGRVLTTPDSAVLAMRRLLTGGAR